MKSKFTYALEDGTTIPLFDAEYDMSFPVRPKDQKGSEIAEPRRCVEAKGICHMPHVIEAWVGSGGQAFVAFKATPSRNYPHALYFTIPIRAARVRDQHDKKKRIKKQILLLRAPTAGRTLERLRYLNKRRRQEVKNGAPVKHRGKKNRSRIERLGVPHRPRARVDQAIVNPIAMAAG